jgi:hypothetical protein
VVCPGRDVITSAEHFEWKKNVNAKNQKAIIKRDRPGQLNKEKRNWCYGGMA